MELILCTPRPEVNPTAARHPTARWLPCRGCPAVGRAVASAMDSYGNYFPNSSRTVAIENPDCFGLHLAERDGYYTEVIPMRVLSEQGGHCPPCTAAQVLVKTLRRIDV